VAAVTVTKESFTIKGLPKEMEKKLERASTEMLVTIANICVFELGRRLTP